MKKVFFALVTLLSLLIGCATGGSASSTSANAGMDLDTVIKEAAIQMETKIPSKTMVALVSVASPATAFSTQVLTRLESAIVSSGKLVVVDRANLDKVRAEQGFQLSGEVDDESAKSIGKLLGAGAIVTGSLTDLGDVYSLTLKAINIDTATVAVSYLADLSKTTRIETLLATKDGAATGGTTTAASSSRSKKNTVSFYANGATGGTPPGALSVQEGESITIPDAGSLSKARAIFKGWAMADSSELYTAGDTLEVKSSITLYAQWEDSVSVSFLANGATGTPPETLSVQKGESIKIPGAGSLAGTAKIFNGWNTSANGGGTSYKANDTVELTSNVSLYAQWKHDPNYVYKIGNTGPAGGIIFFDKGNNSGGWRYLEAAPASTEAKDLQWSVKGFDAGAKGIEPGTGKLNTRNIMDASVQAAVNAPAARYCDRLEYGGYDDWYLPSKKELGLMYMNLKVDGLGGFGAGWYWTSSESGHRGGVWVQNFGNGGESSSHGSRSNKNQANSTRAIRQF